MAAMFRHWPSLPATTNSCFSHVPPNHVRSDSVPCCSHPAVAHLHDEIGFLRSLSASRKPDGSVSDWITETLDRISRVQEALGDLLHLPQAAQGTPLCGRQPIGGGYVDRLLDDALYLADAYGSLLSVADALKHHAAEARAAIRRGDFVRLSSAVRSLRRAEKDLGRLADTIKKLSKSFQPDLMKDAAEVELAGIIEEAVVATATASVAIITRAETLSSSAAAAAAATLPKDSLAAWSLKRLPFPKHYRHIELPASASMAEIEAFERLEEMQESLERLEKGSKKVFSKLVNTRVSFLNTFAPSL